jgi:hypothetical protein
VSVMGLGYASVRAGDVGDVAIVSCLQGSAWHEQGKADQEHRGGQRLLPGGGVGKVCWILEIN